MFHIHVPVGLGLVLALGAGSAVWTARLDGKDGSKISGTAQVESITVMPPSDSAILPKDTIPPAGTSTTPAKASPEELRVTVTLSNAPANASLSWYLYSGTAMTRTRVTPNPFSECPRHTAPSRLMGQATEPQPR